MKIYTFTNKRMNYLSGQFYFAAESKEAAKEMADEFSAKHNAAHPQPAYIIEFSNTILTTEIKPGPLPIGRS